MARRREILGVVFVALTASTVVTLFIAVERAERPVELLENSFPPTLRHDLRNTFSLGVIARKPMKFLDIEVAYLHRFDLLGLGVNITNQGRDAILGVDKIKSLYEMSVNAGIDPFEYEKKGVGIGQWVYNLYLFDFTDVFRPFVGDALLGGYSGSGLTTIYAGLFNESGLMHLYGGSPDFFPRRNISITELTISLNDEKEVYKRMKELSPEELKSGVPTLLDAPDLGRVSLSDLKKDDTVRLAFSVDRSTIRGTNSDLKIQFGNKLEIIKVISDGEIEEFIVNGVVAG